MPPSSLPLLPLLLILALPSAHPLPNLEKVTLQNFPQVWSTPESCVAGGGRRVASRIKALSTAYPGETTSKVLVLVLVYPQGIGRLS